MDKINQSEVNVTFNTVFNMTCRVESYPLAMVHWEGNSEQVNNNVVLVNTSERGAIITYTCVAVNEINGDSQSASNSINVIVQGKILRMCWIYYINNYSVDKVGIYYGITKCMWVMEIPMKGVFL